MNQKVMQAVLLMAAAMGNDIVRERVIYHEKREVPEAEQARRIEAAEAKRQRRIERNKRNA